MIANNVQLAKFVCFHQTVSTASASRSPGINFIINLANGGYGMCSGPRGSLLFKSVNNRGNNPDVVSWSNNVKINAIDENIWGKNSDSVRFEPSTKDLPRARLVTFCQWQVYFVDIFWATSPLFFFKLCLLYCILFNKNVTIYHVKMFKLFAVFNLKKYIWPARCQSMTIPASLSSQLWQVNANSTRQRFTVIPRWAVC